MPYLWPRDEGRITYNIIIILNSWLLKPIFRGLILCSIYDYKQIDECYKERIEKVGDHMKATMCIGGKKQHHSWKLDEESQFEGTLI